MAQQTSNKGWWVPGVLSIVVPEMFFILMAIVSVGATAFAPNEFFLQFLQVISAVGVIVGLLGMIAGIPIGPTYCSMPRLRPRRTSKSRCGR